MTVSQHGKKRPAPAQSPNPSSINEDLSGDDHSSVPGTATYILRDDGSFTEKSNTPRRRRRFDQRRRTEVAMVRKHGACKTCRVRKVRCQHALAKPEANSESSNFLQPNFDASIIATGSMFGGDSKHDVSDVLLDDDLGSIPTPTGRRDKRALDLIDIDNVIGADSSGYDGPHSISNSSKWIQYPPFMIDPSHTLANQYYLAPSAASQHSTSLLSAQTPSPTFASPTAYTNSEFGFPQDSELYQCDVSGCEYAHMFTREEDLRRHQESQHTELYPPKLTHACPISGCKAGPYIRQDFLRTHLTTQHSDYFNANNNLAFVQATNGGVLSGNNAQMEDYANEEIFPTMAVVSNNMGTLSPHQGVLGDNNSYLHGARRHTTSSRGANSPRGRSQGFDGVNRRSSLRQNNSRVRKSIFGEHADPRLQALERSLSAKGPGAEKSFIDAGANGSFYLPVAGGSQGVDAINGMIPEYWTPQNNANSFAQSFRAGGSLHNFPMTSGLQEDISEHNMEDFASLTYPNVPTFSRQAPLSSNMNWNQQNNRFPLQLDTNVPDIYDNLQSHSANTANLQSQGDFRVPSSAYPHRFVSASTPHSGGIDNHTRSFSSPINKSNQSLQYIPQDVTLSLTPVIVINDETLQPANLPQNRLRHQNKFTAQGHSQQSSITTLDLSTSVSSSGANESLTTPMDIPNSRLHGYMDMGAMNDSNGTNQQVKIYDFNIDDNISGFFDLDLNDQCD